MIPTDRPLNCFYDFSTSPAYHDFITFLQIAELHRIRHGFDTLRIIFVPGPKEGFRNDKLRTTESNQLMARNVLLPACHLLKSCTSVMWLDQRELAQGLLSNPSAVFPRDYTLENSISDYLEPAIQCAFLRDEVISYFTAPADKQKTAQAFIKSVCGNKKPLTITLREASHDHSDRRSINETEWLKFFEKIDLNIYQPIIVRDTACVFDTDNVFPGYPKAPMASIDVLFRIALYENSYVNFFVNNGPYIFSLYTKYNSIVFKYSCENVLATTKEFLKNNVGLAYGDQRPITEKRTIIAWEDDDENVISAYFEFMVDQIESGVDLSEQHNVSSGEQIFNTIRIALNYIFIKFKYSVCEEDLRVLLRIQQMNEILKDEPRWQCNLKEIILSNEGKMIPRGSLEKIKQLENTIKIGLKL